MKLANILRKKREIGEGIVQKRDLTDRRDIRGMRTMADSIISFVS
jgi:hypothetical protein